MHEFVPSSPDENMCTYCGMPKSDEHHGISPNDKVVELMAKEIAHFHGHPMFLELTIDELALHSAKNADYAHVGDPLGNFYRVSDALKAQGFDVSPVQVAILYAQKQQDAAIQMLAHGYEGKVENFDTRARDVHVYWKIARILHAEEARYQEALKNVK